MSFGKMGVVALAIAFGILGCDGAKSRSKKLSEVQIQRALLKNERQARKTEYKRNAIRCSKIRNVLKVKVDSACVTSKGRLFVRIDDGGTAGFGWQDLDAAVVWYDEVARNENNRKRAGVSLPRALDVCTQRELDLPSAEDFERASANGLSEILCLSGSDCQGFKNKGFAFWSATPDAANPGLYWIYDLQANMIPGAIMAGQSLAYDTVGGICVQK